MRRLFGSGAAVLIAAALAAGCGGSSSKAGDKPGQGTSTTSAGSPDGTSFSKLLGEIGKHRFKITYADASGNSQVYAQDGTGNTVTINGDSQVFTTRSSTIDCEKNGDTFACTQRPIALGANSFYVALSAAEKTYATALRYHFGHTSSKTIAGRDADCFTITAKDFGSASAIAGAAGASLKGAASYCNDRETGAVLENTTTDEAGETTTALLVTTFEEPSDSDFTPPATPTVETIPGGPVTVPGGVGAQ